MTCHILVDEVLYHAAAECVAEVDNMMLKAHLLSVMLRLHDGVNRTAALLFRQARLFYAVVCTESDAHNFVALLQKKHGTNGGVYSSGHSEKHTFFHCCISTSLV